MTKHSARLDKLAQIFGQETSEAATRPRPNPDHIAVLDALEDLRRSGVRPSAELRELAIARGLEKQGYTAAQIAELLPHYVEQFERAKASSKASPKRFG
jgi:hypothetical protein